MRGDAFLALMAPFLSRTRLKQKIQSGESLLNGRRYGAANRLRAGDEVELAWWKSVSPSPPPELRVLYEDEVLVAVDKPAGVAVHPTGRRQSGTIVHGMLTRYREEISRSLARGDASFYPGIVNRLDVFTSGVVLFGKRREATAEMHRRIGRGEVHKRYVALVRGQLEAEEGSIDLPIGRDPTARIRLKHAVRSDGRPSLTRYRVLERLSGHTLVEANPVTGRQHQIRLHLAAIGHPVWGDLLYDDEGLFLRYHANGCRLDPTLPPRHCLHAELLEFSHPRSGETVRILSPLPADFLAIVAGLHGGS
jgi:23S rRNA pseudouridine1911/1915/1917 synthase